MKKKKHTNEKQEACKKNEKNNVNEKKEASKKYISHVNEKRKLVRDM